MYQAGEFIVYGTNSVCRVESIGKPPFETEEDKLEARTDGSDAFDVLCIGTETKPVFQGTGGTTNTYG